MIDAFKYTTRVWLTTALTLPLIILGAIALKDALYLNAEIADAMSFYIMFVLFSAVISFIPFLISAFVVYFILLQGATGIKARLCILLYGLSASVIILLLLFGGPEDITYDQDIWIFIVAYVLCLSASIYLYKLPQLYIDHQENSTT